MPQPTPTPTPAGINLFGQEFPMYGPDVDEYMQKYLGDEFFRLIEEKESGKSKVGPRPGWDYKMGAPMNPADAADAQRYLDMRSKHFKTIPTPTPSPTPTVNVPGTAGEARSWLQRLLEND